MVFTSNITSTYCSELEGEAKVLVYDYGAKQASPPSQTLLHYHENAHHTCNCKLRTYTRCSLPSPKSGNVIVATHEYQRGVNRPSSDIIITTQRLGSRYVSVKEIAQCVKCEFVLLRGTEMSVFGQIGAASTLRFTVPDDSGEPVIFDFAADSILSVNPIYKIKSSKPAWAYPAAPADDLHYLIERTNPYERD